MELNEKTVEAILRWKDDLDSLAQEIDAEDPLTVKMDLERDLARIMKAFDRMTNERKRERIEMYLFSDMTQIEQANYFNTSQPNIKRDYLRALRALIRLIE